MDKDDELEQKMSALCEGVAEGLTDVLPLSHGFVLIVSSLKGGCRHYFSTLDDESAIRLFEEFIARKNKERS